MASDRTVILMKIEGPKESTNDQLLSALREMLEVDGAEPGSLDVIDEEPGSLRVNAETDELFYEDNLLGWEREKGAFRASFEERACVGFVPSSVSKLIVVQVETSHYDANAVAFYAYFEGGECDVEQVRKAFEDEDGDLVEGGGEPFLEGGLQPEEVPNRLSRATGLRRFFVCQAC